MIQTGLMAETYGKTPAEIMHADHLAPIEAFQFNSDVMQATAQFKEDMKERQRQNANPNGVASTREQRDMVNEQIERGESENQTPSEQMQNLDSVLEQRADTMAPDADPDSQAQPQPPEPDADDGMTDLQHLMGGSDGQ